MLFSRRQSVTLAVGIIVLFFLIVTFSISSRTQVPIQTTLAKEDQSPTTDKQQEQASLPEAGHIVLDDFHRSEVKDGRKLWEIRAKQGRVVPNESRVQVTDATLWVYRKDGDTLILKAPQAFLKMEGTKISSVEAQGGVHIQRNQEISLETEKAIYNQVEEVVTAPGPVLIKSATMELRGRGLKADIKSKQLQLLEDVSTIVLSQPTSQILMGQING